MADERVLERIRRWEASGLVDAGTAARLREDELAHGSAREPVGGTLAGLGGGLSVVEAFIYLGLLLVLGAWYWQVAQIADGQDRQAILAVGAAIPAAVFAIAGFAARSRPDRVGRAAGVLFLFASAQVGIAVNWAADVIRPDEQAISFAIGSMAWLLAAITFRVATPSFATTLGLLAALATAGLFVGDWLGSAIWGEQLWTDDGQPLRAAPGSIQPLLSAAWWLAVASLGGLVVRFERRSGTDPAARRRTALARLGTGGIAVLGVAWAVLGSRYGWEPQLEPIVGEVLIVTISVGLAWLASRSGSSMWLYPAGLGILIALTHLNASYLDDAIGTGPALLVEGLILIGVGVGVELSRRRLHGPPAEAAPSGA